jgi:hypothetical protein
VKPSPVKRRDKSHITPYNCYRPIACEEDNPIAVCPSDVKRVRVTRRRGSSGLALIIFSRSTDWTKCNGLCTTASVGKICVSLLSTTVTGTGEFVKRI